MYSLEERIRAVQLYIKYDHSLAATINELGYPSHQMLLRWYKEFVKTGGLHESYKKKSKYSEAQKQKALEHYRDHGQCVARTARVLGYPSRQQLQTWVDAAYPKRKKRCVSSNSLVEFPQKQKERATIDLCARTGSAEEIARKYGVTRGTLYKWTARLLEKERTITMPKKKSPGSATADESVSSLSAEKAALEKQVRDLKKDVYRLQLERDILVKAGEVLKKGQGINLESMTNHEKAVVIDALRDRYRLKELLGVLRLAKSSYCYQEVSMRKRDKYAEVCSQVKNIFAEAKGCYGYRRIWTALKTAGSIVSEKIIRRIMKEECLVVPFVKRKKYSSYAGEVSPAVDNIIDRNFSAEIPNTKWLTDITEFRISAGKVYLSPIIDCFDGLVVAWAVGTAPDAKLANSMLDEAISLLSENDHPIVHSDRGGHYRWPGWIERMEKANLTKSMSKKGCSPDNSACEGFFGRLKNEMFYGRSWMNVTIDSFMSELDAYIRWYNEKRIKLSLGGLSPLEYRRSLGMIA